MQESLHTYTGKPTSADVGRLRPLETVVEKHEHERACKGEARTDQSRILHAQPGVNRQTAKESSHRVAEVESQLHHCAAHQFPSGGMPQKEQLLGR